MLFAFFYPRRQAVKARHVGHVIHEDHGVHVSVIVLDHAFSESLLSRRVPQLDLDSLPINLHRSFSEIHPDRSLGAVGEAAGAEAVGQARLAHIGVANHDYLEDAGASRWQKP